MILFTKRRHLTRTLRNALNMCVGQRRRVLNGHAPLTTTKLAAKWRVTTRTIFRWIAAAEEAGALRIKRTGRVPRWAVKAERIAELRSLSGASYGRRMEGRLPVAARNVRWGYKQALFAHHRCPSSAPDLKSFTPHTPYSFEFTPSSSQNQNPPTSLPLVSPPRVGFSRLTSPGVAATTLLLKLAAQASEGCERAAARCVAESGLLTAADGAPLNVSGARRLISRFREQRANGSDCERSATASHLQRDCMNGGRHV